MKKKIGLILSTLLGLLLIGGTYYWLMNESNSKYDDLYEQFYSKYDDTRLLEYDNNPQKDKLAALYESNQYEKAIQIANQFLTNSYDEIVEFYIACCLMEQEKQIEALTIFNALQENEESPIKEALDWYTSLCYLKLRKIDDLEILSKRVLETPNHIFYSKFKLLQQKL